MRFTFTLLAALGTFSAYAQTQGVGIGVSTPLSRLHVADGSVLFSAAGDVPASAAIPVSGAGRRMLWYADKAAFRAGYVGSFGSTYWDDNNIGYYSFATGWNPRASGQYAFAAGLSTTASGDAAVALGNNATASGERSLSFNSTASGFGAIALGSSAQATIDDAVAIGPSAIAGGIGSIVLGPSIANGSFAVAIGLQNQANGQFATALGKNARANNYGSVTISDASASFSTDYVTSSANNQMTMRFAGGYYLYSTARANAPTPTNTTPAAGVQLTPGAGAWTTLSDRRKKENFRPLDAEQVLRKVAALPITEWNYKSQPSSQRHVGPMAQDFYEAFRLDGIGRDTTINTADIDGINMVAIQALARRTVQLQQENEQLRAQLRQKDEQLATQLQALNERLATLEQPIPHQPRRRPATPSVATN